MPEFEETEGGLMVSFVRKNMTKATAPQVTPQATPQATPQVDSLIAAIGAETLSVKALMAKLSLKDRSNFLSNYLNPAI